MMMTMTTTTRTIEPKLLPTCSHTEKKIDFRLIEGVAIATLPYMEMVQFPYQLRITNAYTNHLGSMASNSLVCERFPFFVCQRNRWQVAKKPNQRHWNFLTLRLDSRLNLYSNAFSTNNMYPFWQQIHFRANYLRFILLLNPLMQHFIKKEMLTTALIDVFRILPDWLFFCSISLESAIPLWIAYGKKRWKTTVKFFSRSFGFLWIL